MTITAVPLPTLFQLAFLGYLRQPGGNELAKPWLRDGDLGGLWTSGTAWSLAILAEAFRRQRGRAPIVAVPEYICNQSLWPLRQSGANLVFLPVNGDTLRMELKPSLAFDLLMVVHYFGWPADLDEAAALAGRRGGWLIEDCAHVLTPIAGIGESGSAALYSPHKLLAAPDGAVLVARPPLRLAERHLVEAAKAAGWAQPGTSLWRAKRLIQAGPLGRFLKIGGQPDFSSDPLTRPMAHTPAPSPAAARLIARADLAEIARRRRANYAALHDAILNLAPWQPLMPTSASVAPYRLAMRCPSFEVASALYARLRAANLPVESWPDLPPEVAKDSGAGRLRASVLFLACHQGCDADELASAYARALGGKS